MLDSLYFFFISTWPTLTCAVIGSFFFSLLVLCVAHLFLSIHLRAKLLTPYSLAVYDVGRRDRGMYQCLVTNRESSAQAVAELKLGGKFFFYDIHNGYILNAKTLAHSNSSWIKCQFIMKTAERTEWYTSFEHTVLFVFTFIVMLCDVAWRCGDVRALDSWTLTEITPEIISTFNEQIVRPGQFISFKCAATGSPPPQVCKQKHKKAHSHTQLLFHYNFPYIQIMIIIYDWKRKLGVDFYFKKKKLFFNWIKKINEFTQF